MLDTTYTECTAEGIAYNIECAGPFVRGCAFAIDSIIQFVIIATASAVYAAFLGRAGMWLVLLVIFAVNWFYFFLWETLGGGASPGKRIFGLRVIQNDGSPVSLSSSFIRNLLRFADTFLYAYVIALVCMSFSPCFRRIGDWAGGTLVVWTSKAGRAYKKANYAALPEHIKAIAPKKQLSFTEKRTIMMFAGSYNVLGKLRADEIAHNWVQKNANANDLAEKGISDSEYILGISIFLRGNTGRNK
ncbi:MAG: RDD family protein [Spirochaetaceae bacterium]|jgi:uncharacterized RDD family membrane protein YckC|nr:RDD family protein [Spirochaetaceae bacterium]